MIPSRSAVGSAILLIVAVTTLGSCGGDAEENLPRSRSAALMETERPEIAFIRGGRLALVDDRGENLEFLTGESLPGAILVASGPSWSPEGKRIAVAGMEEEDTEEVGEPERTPPTDIYMIDDDGGDAERVTDVGEAQGPIVSPDGETIIFTRLNFNPETGRLLGELWSVERDSSRLTQLTEGEVGQTDSAGSFSPDGSRLAFTRIVLDRETADRQTAIYVMNPDGSGQERLIERASDPAFSPDGERIAYVSDRDRNGELSYGDRTFFANELYVAGADGSDPERLTETDAINEAHPSWLRDGSRIAYQRGEQVDNAEATSILQINADGSCSREFLRSRHGADRMPAWRPSEPREGGGPLSC